MAGTAGQWHVAHTLVSRHGQHRRPGPRGKCFFWPMALQTTVARTKNRMIYVAGIAGHGKDGDPGVLEAAGNLLLWPTLQASATL